MLLVPHFQGDNRRLKKSDGTKPPPDEHVSIMAVVREQLSHRLLFFLVLKRKAEILSSRLKWLKAIVEVKSECIYFMEVYIMNPAARAFMMSYRGKKLLLFINVCFCLIQARRILLGMILLTS